MRLAIILTLAGVAVASLRADVVIRETSGAYQIGVDYFVLPNGFGEDAALFINSSNYNDIWVIEAYDTVTNLPEDIEFIGISTLSPGGIRMVIRRARDIWEIDLVTNRGTSVTELNGMTCTGDYGAVGALRVGRISNSSVAGELLDWIVPTGSIDGNISVGKLSSTISAPQCSGDLTVTGIGPHSGNITINSPYAGDMTINGQMQGDVTVAGGYSGALSVGTNMLGDIDIGGNFNGSISIGGNVVGDIAVGDSSSNVTSGTIAVTGNASGNLNLGYAMTGQVTIGGDLSGSIDLKEDMEPQAAIRIDGSIVDSGSNHARIGRMVRGTYPDPGSEFIVGKQVGNTVTGGNVSLRGNGEWFQLGKDYPHSGTVNHYGFIKFYGTLSSPLVVSGEFRCKVEIGKIDGADDGAKPSGLLADGNFGSENTGPSPFLGSDITIGEFTRGAIGFVNDTGTPQDPCFLLGRIHISDALPVPGVGQTSTGDMKAEARITCENSEDREIVLVADIQIDGDMEGDIIGTHSINDYDEPYSSGAISIAGNMTSTASIKVVEVTGPGACAMTDKGPISDTIAIGGDMAGEISTMLHSSTVPSPAGLRGEVSIGGDLSGTIRSGGDFDGAISVGGDLPGEIRIDGSLKNSEAEFEVDVVGSAEASGAIAVDYDGFDANQDWESGAVVRIDGEEYVEASDAVNYLYEAPNIWHVTECVGDCNNDAVLDAFDVEPFTVALTGEAQYATAYPGLGGSRVHHADIDCSGVVDAFDIEPFINQLLIGCGQMCIAPRPAGGWPIVAVLSLRTGLVNSVFAIPSACDPFDDKADRMIALFQEHVSARHHTTLANECAFLSAYYWEAGQTRRSEMFLRVSSALSE